MNRRSEVQAAAEAPEILTVYTAAEVLAKLERDAAESVLPKAYAKPVTCDQVDLFNTQGGLFA